MDNKIITYSTLWNLVEIDTKNHYLKDITTLFLSAMLDWPTYNQTNIEEFIKELKNYFGTPLTIEKIDSHKLDISTDLSVWRNEAGSSIADLIDISTKFCNQSNFDEIIENILNYYSEEFNKVDFIAELQYLKTEQGGRKTPANSGYRPQVKFDFTEMQTSGQQTFIDKETVYPGDKVDAKIKLLSPDYFTESLIEDMEFEFREGSTVIGTGKIKHIINDKLEKASR
ncbi:MAG TPA: hypothetical protein VFS71_12795 [Flavobacterium sp.]|uniref:EF-Tu C-terminal domain-related protein n=1 Tax=Flavobacterium sp. TaxID=239 RepID=UPI002DB6D35E|nr:hypothetical protein [Flavobacterium sp.]HEU4790558.1 hypothetical protein [Flavobacterium sp.]